MTTNLGRAWSDFCHCSKCGDDRQKMLRVMHLVNELIREFRSPYLLLHTETVALTKKVLCRALRAEFTRAEVEAFLRG